MHSRMVMTVLMVLELAARPARAQSSRPPGSPGGGETVASNNLSFPAIDLESAVAFQTLTPSGTQTLGQTYSYGCAVAETIGTTTYPNTSCIDPSTGAFQEPAQCTRCILAGAQVDPIYWQQTANRWSADARPPEVTPVTARYVDWGDNLESRTWPSTSVLRVEVTPFADRTAEIAAGTDSLYRGLQMWHVSGQGQTEMWGVHAQAAALPAAYSYQAPIAIIRTLGARLNITKIVLGGEVCPVTAQPEPIRPDLVWNGSAWVDSGGGTGSTWVLRDISFAPELNIGGKYVYGYNWQLRRDGVPASVGKSGWWRLTFYAPADVAFASTTVTTPPDMSPYPAQPFVAPVLALATPVQPAAQGAPGGSGKGGSGGPPGGGGDTAGVYTPVVDPVNGITYLDICIK